MRQKYLFVLGSAYMAAVALCQNMDTKNEGHLNLDPDISQIFGTPPLSDTAAESRCNKLVPGVTNKAVGESTGTCKRVKKVKSNDGNRCKERRAVKQLSCSALRHKNSPKLNLTITEKLSKFEGTCGYSNPGANFIQSRFGEPNIDYAEFGEFPWMVAVLKRSESEGWIQANYLGGGSLIHPMVVMTVVEVVRDAKKNLRLKPDQVMIRAGDWVTDSQDEIYDHQDRNVSKIVIREFNCRRSTSNDIGLLFLEAPVDLDIAPQIGIGCLAPEMPPAGTFCFSMGWGVKDFSNKQVFSTQLKKISLPLLGKEKCEGDMRKARLANIFQQHKYLVCAGGEEGIGNCLGDSGSPLVCPIASGNSRFAIYGMYAYSIQPACGVKDVPGVYFNVPNLYVWIKQQFIRENLETKFFSFM